MPSHNFYQSSLQTVQSLLGFSRQEIFRVKLILLSKGVCLTSDALAEIYTSKKLPQRVRSGASNGLDIVLPGNTWVNVPVYEDLPQQLSPILDFTTDGFVLKTSLKHAEVPIVVLPKPDYYSAHTSQGMPMNKVGQMFADRIGFGLTNQCYFWKKERRCAFCSIGKNMKNELATKPDEIILETLTHALEDTTLPPRHILLSGGTFPEDGWTTKPFASLAKRIKLKTSLPIYLMAVPPVDLGELELLFESQISEIALNIEIYSPRYAAKIIPGKTKEIGVKTYLKAIEKARQYWGQSQVRSLLVAGLEPAFETLEGVKAILDAGGTPILSAFRPLAGSALSSHKPRSVNWLESLYYKANDLASRYGASLGPECDACKANCIA